MTIVSETGVIREKYTRPAEPTATAVEVLVARANWMNYGVAYHALTLSSATLTAKWMNTIGGRQACDHRT